MRASPPCLGVCQAARAVAVHIPHLRGDLPMHAVTLFGLAKGALWFSLFAHGHTGGQSFALIEEAYRLPEDTSPEGTSSTDVNLVDLDGDGDLDLFISEGTASQAGRPNRLYLNNGQGVFSDASATLLAG